MQMKLLSLLWHNMKLWRILIYLISGCLVHFSYCTLKYNYKSSEWIPQPSYRKIYGNTEYGYSYVPPLNMVEPV